MHQLHHRLRTSLIFLSDLRMVYEQTFTRRGHSGLRARRHARSSIRAMAAACDNLNSLLHLAIASARAVQRHSDLPPLQLPPKLSSQSLMSSVGRTISALKWRLAAGIYISFRYHVSGIRYHSIPCCSVSIAMSCDAVV